MIQSTEVDKIAQAVLYEGYLLYPYRLSALKNQQRWNFGVLYPPSWAVRQTGSDRSYFQLECIVRGSEKARLDVSVRFLQLVARDRNGITQQEAVEQTAAVDCLLLRDLITHAQTRNFFFSGSEASGPDVVRRKVPIEGQMEISAALVDGQLFRVTLQFRNTTCCLAGSRDDALMHSFASAHAVLQVRDAEFVSQIDPPEDLRDAVKQCQNTGVWPVLVGENGAHDITLGSPIILYDYPQIAPESRGDLFDGTEIDEILTLRILTLTGEEKEEMRRSDERARQLLERLETAPFEHLLDLHGAMRNLPNSQATSGSELKEGDRVYLRPGKRADIFDTFLQGKTAIIEAVEQDFEGNIHFAVVLEDDPGKDLGEMRQAGHRFFFSKDEVEPIDSSQPERT